MPKALKAALVSLAAALSAAGAGAAAAAPTPLTGPVNLTFAVQELGTAAYNYASALQVVMYRALPEGSVILATTNSPGGVDAPVLVNEGRCDLVLSNSAPARWAVEGSLPDRPAVHNLASLGGGLGHDFINVMFTRKFVDETGIRTVEELVAKKYPVKLVIKKDGTLGELSAEKVLEAAGTSLEEIRAWGGVVEKTSGYEIKVGLQEDLYEMTIDHIGAGQLNTTELCMTQDMVQVQLAAETLAKLVAIGYDYITIEPGTWNGQTEAIRSAGSQQVVLVPASMNDSVAYTLTKAMCEGAAELAQRVEALESFDPKTAGTRSATGVKLHPGAQAYYQERGWAVE